MKKKILFKEEQKLLNTLLFYVFLFFSVLAIAGMLIPIWLKEGTFESLALPIVPILIIISITFFFIRAKLETTIDEEAIYYRYPPFVNKEKKVSKQEVNECYVRKYKPIWEYGGWGYRVRLGKGKALNVAGNMGLQLVLSNGKGLLLGTQEPDKMKRAIKRLKENWDTGNG